MRIRLFIAAAIATALAVLLVPATALAKGPDAATIDGPGLETPIAVTARNGTLSDLVDQTAFFAALFPDQPEPMLTQAPATDLGSKVVVAWNVPSSQTTADTVRQELYPYAEGGPFVYTEPGQPFLQTERTQGGWYRAPAALTKTLTNLGLPSRADLDVSPVMHDRSTSTIPIVPVIAISVAVVGLGVALVTSLGVAARRRRRVAPA